MHRNLVYTILSDFPTIGTELQEIAELRDKINWRVRMDVVEHQKTLQTSGTVKSAPVPRAKKRRETRKANVPKFTLNDVYNKIDKLGSLVLNLVERYSEETRKQDEKIRRIEEKVAHVNDLT
jgi:hypothetical protein